MVAGSAPAPGSDDPTALKVGPNVNLADLKKGDDVVVRYTQALAVLVEKPKAYE